jgi:hypothetical protein
LQDLLTLARRDGFKGMKLSDGRALIALSLPDTLRLYGNGDNQKMAADKYAAERAAAIKRAGINHVKHHLLGNSRDSAARAPYIAPWAI